VRQDNRALNKSAAVLKPAARRFKQKSEVFHSPAFLSYSPLSQEHSALS
jgi:hypothetical protein